MDVTYKKDEWFFKSNDGLIRDTYGAGGNEP